MPRSVRQEPGGHPEDDPGDPESVARGICLRLLTGSPKTRSQLAMALARRGVPDDAAARVLDRFTEVGLIDDRSFAEAWVSSRQRSRGLAKRALASELRDKGVASDVVAETLDGIDPEREEEAARELVRRKLRSMRDLDPLVRRRRLMGALARKGHNADVAKRAIRAELDDVIEDADEGSVEPL